MSGAANENEPRGIEVGVVEARNMPGVFVVEAIDTGDEGQVYEAMFTGPNAEALACEYAAWRYGFGGNG